ncbi:hypothetical protein L218DRAFT_945228 [Marasmius fiardii PR-910]|nr:hypothetical protein L218DRAFT_945228 [Marasmius fiardii PR-910]
MSENGTRDSFYDDQRPNTADASFDDEITFSGYGEISHSEITFLPSAPSEVLPQNTSPSYRRNAKRQPPPLLKKNILLRREQVRFKLLSINAYIIEAIRQLSGDDDSIAIQAQKAVMSKPEVDFNGLVSTLRTTRSRIYENRPATSYLKLVDGGSHRGKNEGTLEEKKLETYRCVPSLELDRAAGPARQANGTPTAATSPQTPTEHSKPWRSGPLPRRSPLPRWDLMDSDVVLEGRHYKLKPGFHVNLPVV